MWKPTIVKIRYGLPMYGGWFCAYRPFRNDPAIRSMLAVGTDEINSRIRLPEGGIPFNQIRARLVLAVLGHTRTVAHIWDFSSDRLVRLGLKLMSCFPAGVLIDLRTGPRKFTACHMPAVCPHCRSRVATDVLRRLLPLRRGWLRAVELWFEKKELTRETLQRVGGLGQRVGRALGVHAGARYVSLSHVYPAAGKAGSLPHCDVCLRVAGFADRKRYPKWEEVVPEAVVSDFSEAEAGGMSDRKVAETMSRVFFFIPSVLDLSSRTAEQLLEVMYPSVSASRRIRSLSVWGVPTLESRRTKEDNDPD